MKKILSFVFTSLLLSSLFLVIPSTNLTVSSFDNIPEDAIRIKTMTELAAIGGEQSADKYYVLENDINLKNEWIPINDFQGTFDGRGYSINNLYVSAKSNRQYAGLFGSADGATIENVAINIASQGVNANFNLSYAGGLIGLSSNSTVKNCYTIGDVSASSNGESYAGGLIGSADGSTISNCYATGNITASSTRNSSYSGGLIGLNNESIIENSYRLSTQKIKGEKIDESGKPLTAAQMRNKLSFKEWDFEGVWALKKGINKDYPVLRTVKGYREADDLEKLLAIIKEMAEEINGYTVLVLDLSSSMSKNPALALIDSAATFCKTNLATDGNQVAIIPFYTNAQQNSGFRSVYNSNLVNWINTNINYNKGRTNLGEAVDEAMNLLRTILDNSEKNIFIMSDGKPNEGKDKQSYVINNNPSTIITYPYVKRDYQNYRHANYIYEKVYDFKKGENCHVWVLALFQKFSNNEREKEDFFPRKFLQDLVAVIPKQYMEIP